MGGTPRWALVSLALPVNLPVIWVERFYYGLDEMLAQFDAFVVGGNLSGGQEIVADLTLLGDVARDRVLTRAGAHPGDLLCVTGDLGRSAAGRAALDAGRRGAIFETAIRAHLTPVPRVPVGQTLAGTGALTAMIDISDGLAGDLPHLCDASGSGAIVDAARLPIGQDTRAIAETLGLDALTLALSGGEDFELLFTVTPALIDRVGTSVCGVPVTVIGEIRPAAEGIQLQGAADGTLTIAGWDHFRGGAAGRNRTRENASQESGQP